jgi:HEAT repeat protein
MEARRRPVGAYLVVGIIAAGLIAWLIVRAVEKQGLIRNLSTNNMQVRVAAARTLLEREQLVDALPAQPVIRRSKTAQALGIIGSDEAIRALGVILNDQEDAPKRWARQALVKIGKRSVPILMTALAASGGTKDEAVTALKQLGPSVAPSIRFLLTDRAAYKGAAEALSQMGRPGIQALVDGCHAVDKDLRKATLDNLGLQHVRAAVPACLDNLRHGDPNANGNAITALGAIGDRSVAPNLIPFLKGDDRLAAVTSLGLLRYPGAVGPILATCTETEKSYRGGAILALHRIGRPAFAALTETLKSPNVLLRRAAASALVRSNAPDLNGVLSAALKDPDEEVRAAAAQALGFPGNVVAIGPLVAALSDPQWRVVDAAVEGLSSLGVGAVPSLLAIVRNPAENTTVCYQISQALATMGRSAVPALVAALSSPQPEIQKWAAIALGDIGDPNAVEPLQRLADRTTGDLKWVAQEQLRILAGTTSF